jgi:Raf kinase inhibitor-like YbhB/YbcL family protein
MRRFVTPCLLCIAASLGLAGCNPEAYLATNDGRVSGIWAVSLAGDFPNNGTIPAKYAAPSNISPPLSWTPHVNSIVEYVLIVEDVNASGGPKTHWIVYSIPAATPTLAEGAASSGKLVQGTNDMGVVGYTGPESTDKHEYAFQLFALFQPIGIPAGAKKEAVVAAMAGKVVAKSRLNGFYP